MNNKIKSAATEVTALKTQTPIVAKPTEKQELYLIIAASVGICIFNKFIIDTTAKRYSYPIKIIIALAKIFSWFGNIIIP